MYARYGLITIIALLLAGTGAGMERTMDIGESSTITATVTNPLDVPDIIMVKIDGPATASGQVSLALPDNTTSTGCTRDRSQCRVYLAAHESEELPLTVTAEQPGTRPMTITATSTTTRERSENSMTVTVRRSGLFAGIRAWIDGIIGR